MDVICLICSWAWTVHTFETCISSFGPVQYIFGSSLPLPHPPPLIISRVHFRPVLASLRPEAGAPVSIAQVAGIPQPSTPPELLEGCAVSLAIATKDSVHCTCAWCWLCPVIAHMHNFQCVLWIYNFSELLHCHHITRVHACVSAPNSKCKWQWRRPCYNKNTWSTMCKRMIVIISSHCTHAQLSIFVVDSPFQRIASLPTTSSVYTHVFRHQILRASDSGMF